MKILVGAVFGGAFGWGGDRAADGRRIKGGQGGGVPWPGVFPSMFGGVINRRIAVLGNGAPASAWRNDRASAQRPPGRQHRSARTFFFAQCREAAPKVSLNGVEAADSGRSIRGGGRKGWACYPTEAGGRLGKASMAVKNPQKRCFGDGLFYRENLRR